MYASLCYVLLIIFGVFTCGLNVGVRIKEASQSAGTFVGEVAKDAKGNVSDVAERVGSAVKNRWALLREPSTRLVLQDRLITAAATTGTFFRRGITGTKDKVAVGKTKVEEVILLHIPCVSRIIKLCLLV